MKTPLDLALRNWRSGEYSVHVDKLLELRDSEELTRHEQDRLETQLMAMARQGVLMDDRLGWYVVEAGGDCYVVSAVSEDWACFYVWEETGVAAGPVVGPVGKTLVLRTLKGTRAR